MAGYPQPENVQNTLSSAEFFRRFVSKRAPAIIRGLPDDEAFKARRWTDLEYLQSTAGDNQVLIEPMHPTSRQFGTDVERVSTTFREFITSLQQEDGPHPYLTTQYAEQDLDAMTVLPPPADALADDYPRVPRLMGKLFLQQVNLWVGKSRDGTTSGLHHDFHDNLYCLLQGKKRFVLYPPKEIEHLYPSGKLDKVHSNGLISYADAPVRSDGLPISLALKARIKALERKLEAIPVGKGKGRQNTKERQALLDAHEEAIDELAQHALEGVDGVELDDVQDDFDALMGDLDDEDGLLGGLAAPGDEEDSEEDEESDIDGDIGEKPSGPTDAEDEDEGEPSSFARIPTALLHQHLGLPSTAVPPADASLKDFPLLQKASRPYVVELSAGDMLYLPASWWHEVTSFSTGAEKSDVHMAFNYWFYPPNNLDNFEEPYEDSLVWGYFRSKDAAGSDDNQQNGKRKAQGDDSRETKKIRT